MTIYIRKIKMLSLFSSRAVLQAPSAVSMLADIKKACGIFLTDGQYNKLAGMPDRVIQALWTHKGALKTLVFFNNDLFDQLLFLTADNINTFFREAKVGVGGNAKEFLDALSARQLAVLQQPVYQQPYYAPVPAQPCPQQFFQANPFAPVHHAHAPQVAQPPHVHSHQGHQHGHQHGHGQPTEHCVVSGSR
jgi:hypothetical protein